MEIQKTNFFDNLINEASNYYFAQLYINVKYPDKKYDYIFFDGIWYEYNEYNILKATNNKAPLKLLKDITVILQDKLKNEYSNIIKTIDPFDPKFKLYTSTYKTNFKNLGTTSYKASIIKELEIYFEDNELLNKLDNNNSIISFNDKLYDFKTQKYRNIEKNDYITIYCDYKHPLSIETKIKTELNNFLFSLFENKDVILFILDAFGFALFTNKFEKIFILSGHGCNGKGVLLSLISKAFSKYFTTPSNQFLTTKYDSSKPNECLYNSNNKKIVSISEPENDSNGDILFNIEFIKKITGNDDVTCRKMYGSNITFKPKFNIFVQCNEKPKLEKVDNAVKRRFIAVDFPFTFKYGKNLKSNERPINSDLKDKFKNEKYYSGFMFLLIEHMKDKFKNDKLNIPLIIQESTNEYIDENNVIGQFLDEDIEYTDDNTDYLNLSSLYKSFKYNNDDNFITQKKFKQGLLLNGLIEKRINGKRAYFKIKLKLPDDLTEDEDD